MTQSSTQHEPRPTSYWVITLLCWTEFAFLVAMSIWSFLNGDTASFIGFLVFAAIFLVAIRPPKWYQRFSRWYTRARGL